MKKKRFQELDALRGIAAIIVVLFHCGMGRQEFNKFLNFGATGVDLFFIISGFVIFMSLKNIKSGKEFMKKRFARLFPTYWTSVTIALIILIVFHLHKGKELYELFPNYFANLTMFQHYLKIPNLDGVYWTMIVEMSFYILMFLIIELKVLKYIVHIFLFLTIFTLVIINNSIFDFLKYPLLFWIPVVKYLPLFLTGIIFYKIYNNETKLMLNYGIIFICFLSQLYLFPFVGNSKGVMNINEYSVILFLYYFLFILFVNQRLKFIKIRPLLFLGKISYPLYLTHNLITMGIIALFHIYFRINFWFVVSFIVLPTVILLGFLINRYIESYYNYKLRNKLIDRNLKLDKYV